MDSFFVIKLLKYGTSCRVRPTASTVLDGFFPYLAQMITSIRGCVMHNDLWPRPISSRSFSHNFVIKLLKYDASCSVRSTACAVLDGFSPYVALMIISMRGCVMPFDLDLYLQGYLAVTLPISLMIFIFGTNTTQEGTMCHISFPGQ